VVKAARAALLMKLVAMSVSQRVFSPGLQFYVLLALSVTEHALIVSRVKWTRPRDWGHALQVGGANLRPIVIDGALVGGGAQGVDKPSGHQEQET